MQTVMETHGSTSSVILNVTATQQCLVPPLTSTGQEPFFTRAYPGPLSLAARLHRGGTNYSDSIDNGWIFWDRPHTSQQDIQLIRDGELPRASNHIRESVACWAQVFECQVCRNSVL